MKAEILSYLNWAEDKILRKKYGSALEVRAGPLIDAILEFELIPIVAIKLGISERTFKRMMVDNLPSIRLTGKRTWKYYFLTELKLKKCGKCKEIKSFDDFYNSFQERSLVKKNWICKSCDAEWTKFRQKNYPEQHRAANAKRRAAELQAIPAWANLAAIREVYRICPDGYVVDHEIPLQGKNVCGLHVENNLQYLTPSDNSIKGNKLPS